MKYSTFELAAAEASAGLKEVDAEIEQLEAKRQSLEAKRELLENLVNQLLMVLPTDQAVSADLPPGLPSLVTGAPFGKPFAVRKEEWPAFVQSSTANLVERR